MIFPESLYAEHGSRKQGVLPRPVFPSGSGVDTTEDITVSLYTVPDEYDLIITSLSSVLRTTGGEVCREIQHRLILQSGESNSINYNQDTGSTLTEMVLNFSGQIWVPTGTIIQAYGKGSAAVQTKAVISYLSGFLVPELD